MARHIRALGVLAVGLLGGCAETSLPEATGKGTINALNAMPESPAVAFLIEERQLGTVGYKGALGAQSYDDLSYTFNFEFLFAGDTEATRIATQMIDMVADTAYTLALTGSVTAPSVMQWERPEREWDGAETVFEVAIAHLSQNLGDIDVYVALPGTVPVLSEERAKLSFGDRMPEIDLESDDYEVIITARDDPATILYQSEGAFFAARFSYTIGIFAADKSITGNISVRSILDSGITTEMPDLNSLPTLRTVHTAFGTGNIDIYRDEDFTAPIFSNLGFGESTGDFPVEEGSVIYTYTATGNPGAIIDQDSQSVPLGQRISTVLVGMQGSELLRIFMTDDRRSIETHAKLRLVHGAANFDFLDIYLVDTGADITDLSPTISGFGFTANTNFVAQTANDIDIILTLPDEKTLLATPLRIDLVEGDVVELLFVDTADPMVADIMVTSF